MDVEEKNGSALNVNCLKLWINFLLEPIIMGAPSLKTIIAFSCFLFAPINFPSAPHKYENYKFILLAFEEMTFQLCNHFNM